ncbi:hypothetical protein ACFO5K_26570 [Nocardia halotolerans]|uniref:DUF4878 domain-containing protein n=1 Tax=Nocardia halotolerans TaxID=1755878 RepID=A0ABV8VS41_9NOCA
MTNPPEGQSFGAQPPGTPPGTPPAGPPPGAEAFPPQPPKKSRTGLFVALGVLGLMVIGALVAGVVLTVQGHAPWSADDKKIEVAVRDFYDTLNDEGFIAAAQLACRADRDEIDHLTPEQRQQFDIASVTARIDDVRDIVISGDDAEATVTGQLTLSVAGEEPTTEDSTQEHLTKEDGTWKICSAPAHRR